MRKGLEEVIESGEKALHTEDEGRDIELDEIEYEARELARLKPY